MTTTIRIQPNRTFETEDEMRIWCKTNLPEFELTAWWQDEENGKFCCTVEGLPPRKEGKKKTKSK